MRSEGCEEHDFRDAKHNTAESRGALFSSFRAATKVIVSSLESCHSLVGGKPNTLLLEAETR